MASRKKLLTTVAALGTAAALALGGTFAWQSISQTALNEAADVVNPGGRLHNDQHWVSARENDNDIYVENFTDPNHGGETIFARVRLEEYMEIVMNYGVDGAQVVETIAGTKTPKADSALTAVDATAKDEFDYTYAVHYFDQTNETDDYFTWTVGTADSERPYYMPTFNMNKDSLLPDLNGTYADCIGGISSRGETQYATYTSVSNDTIKTANEVYDGDSNTTDELSREALNDIIERGKDSAFYTDDVSGSIVVLADKEHTAAQVGETKGLISIGDWMDLGEYDATTHGGYWVYDADGWVYWSSPIAAGETTGLLLDGFSLKNVMDDTWYYAINVVAQFVTADDVGKTTGTGFYADGETVSSDAESLLTFIGVDTGKAAGDDSSAGGDEDSETTGTVSFNVVKASNDSDGFVKNETAANGYQLGKEGSGATIAFNGNATEFTVSANVTGSNKKPVLSLDENHDTYTITPPSGEESQYSIANGSDPVGTFDAATGVLNLSGDEDLDGLTVIATIGGVEYELTLYITRNGTAIWAVFSNSETVEGAYDLTFFTGTWRPSDRTIAAMAGVDEADVVYSTAGYTDSQYGDVAYGDTQGSRTKIQKVLNVRFANEVKPTNLYGTFYSVGQDYADTDYRVTFDFTNLDTSNTTKMRSTFRAANVDTLDLSTWNTSSVTDMQDMFSSCKMTSLTLGEGWDTSNVQIMGSMFAWCTNLTLDCSDWDVSSVLPNEHSAFSGAAKGVTEPVWPS